MFTFFFLLLSVPSILRTASARFRRDQRQMDEEEEMWFNEDDDFANDYSEAVVPSAAAEILGNPNTKKLDADPDGIGKIVDKKATAAATAADATNNGPKPASGTPVKGILNNNASGGQPPGSVPSEMRSALFKRVRTCLKNPLILVHFLF